MNSAVPGSPQVAETSDVSAVATSTAESRPEIIVIGSTEMTEKLRRALEETSAVIRATTAVTEVDPLVGPTTVAVLFEVVDTVDPEDAVDTVDQLAQCRGLDDLPLFVVVDDDFEDERAQALYERGATVVFAWPSEVLLMPRIIVEMLDVTVHEHARQNSDSSLTEALTAHLSVEPDLAERVECEVRGGCAILRGEVESLWKKQRLLNLVEHVPGIVGIIAQDVMVYPPETPDPVLGDTIMAALRSAGPIDPDTLCISVMDAMVTIAGTVRTREELRRVQSIVENIEGVRKVDNLTIVSPEDAARVHRLVEEIRAELKEKFPEATIDLSVLGSVVILRGHVKTLALRRRVEQAVLDDVPGVQRVVNKLSVIGTSE